MSADERTGSPSSTAWERRVGRTATGFAVATLAVLGAIAVALATRGLPLWIGLPVAVAVAAAVHAGLSAPVRRRRRILAAPFPAEWERVLEEQVDFYAALPADRRAEFRRRVQLFLGEKRITGIKTDVDVTTRVLTAASAVIPIFGFPEWEWDQIREVLIYPSRFGEDFSLGEGADHRTLGMVGSGFMNGMMILSKPDLLAGFRNSKDRRNVGVHEFAHLVDKSDGTIDGLPTVGLERQAIGPWIELVRREMRRIHRGRSSLDPYAGTNEAEFFAVATEYFFERPGELRRRHPELHAMLSRLFHPGGR